MGFEIKGKEQMVYRLHKALYGLKQAPKAWYSKIDKYFAAQGFKKSDNEYTLYKKAEENGNILLVCIYVDDIVCLSSSIQLVTEFKTDMMKQFEMSDLGMLTYFLGVEVIQDELGVFISQKKYTLDLLRQYNMHNCKAVPTPMCTSTKLQTIDGQEIPKLGNIDA